MAQPGVPISALLRGQVGDVADEPLPWGRCGEVTAGHRTSFPQPTVWFHRVRPEEGISPGVYVVADFQPRQGTDEGCGCKRGAPPAVALLDEGQLPAGVWAFPAH